MKNIDFSNDLLRRLYIVTIISVIFILFLLIAVFFMGANNEQNKLKIINEHYSALILTEFDTILHDIKVGSHSENLGEKLESVLKYHSSVDAVYLLEQEDAVIGDNKEVLDVKTTILQTYTNNPNLYTDNLVFYGLDNAKNDFLIDKFVFNDDDDVYSLIAYKIPDDKKNKTIVALINLQTMADKFILKESHSFLLDKDGYMYLADGNNHTQNIYDVISLNANWKDLNSGFAFSKNNKWRYYSINYIPIIGVGVYSQRYFTDILFEYGPLTILTLCLFLLFSTMLVDTLLFARNDFVIPIEKFKDFFAKLSNSEFSSYNFSSHKEIADTHKRAVEMFFENKDLKNKLDSYQQEHDLLFESGNLIILYVDAKDGRILFCSEQALKFYGYTKSQMLTKTLFDLEESNLYDFYAAHFGLIKNGIPVGNIHVTRTGERRVVNLSISQVSGDLNSFHIVVVHDITRLMNIANMIKDIDNIVQYGTTLVLGITKDLVIKQTSDNIESIIKYKKDDILDEDISLLDLVEDTNAQEDIKQHISSRTSSLYDQNVKMKLANGDIHWFRTSIKVIANDNIVAYVFLNDITLLVERTKTLEADVELKDEHLEGVITWLYDVNTKAYEFHNSFFSLFDDSEYYTKIMQKNILYKFITPGFVENLEAEIQKSIDDKKYSFDIKVKATKKVAGLKVAGQYGNMVDLWLNFKGHQATLNQRDGKTRLVVIGILEDISIKVATEARVNLLAKIFETSQEGIVITDNEQKIKDANDSFTKITGYDIEEIQDKTPAILKSEVEGQGKSFYDSMWNSIRQFGKWQGEIYNKKKNNEVYPELLSITAIRDEENKISNYIGMFTDITNIKAKENELIQMAYYDKLTGLPNKEKFTQTLDEFAKTTYTTQKKFAVLFMDLDGFKAANDTYGHECGDTVLEIVAQRLQAIFKTGKVSKNSIVARLGGDEFTAILSDIESEKDVRDIADNIISKIGEVFIIGEFKVSIGVTIGITYYPQKNTSDYTSKELLEQADWAMYQAKLAGKNRYYELNDTSSAIFSEYKNLLAKFENFDPNNFSILYQPVYDVINNKICAYEVQLNIKESKALSTSNILTTLSQKYWFSDLNIWVMQSALDAFNSSKLEGEKLFINIPISQLNSTLFFKKFKDLSEKTPLLNVKVVLSDLFTTRSPVDEVNELEKRYKDFGISFLVDEIDEKANELIKNLDINIKDLRAHINYTRRLADDYYNIEKLDYIMTICKDEDKNLSAKFVQNALTYKILTAFGYNQVSGAFIHSAVDDINKIDKSVNTKKEYLGKLALKDKINKDNLINFYKFIIFQISQLDIVISMLDKESLEYFDLKLYERNFLALQKNQDVSLSWICDDAKKLIKDLMEEFKKQNAYKEKNKFINNMTNEKLKLQNNIIGE